MKRLLVCAMSTRTSHAAVTTTAQLTYQMADPWHTPHGNYTGFYTQTRSAV